MKMSGKGGQRTALIVVFASFGVTDEQRLVCIGKVETWPYGRREDDGGTLEFHTLSCR